MGIFYEKDDLESLRDSWTSKSPLGVGLIFGFTTILGKCQNLALRQLRTYSNLSAVDHEWFMKADWRTSRNTIDLIYEFAVHSVQNQLIKRVLRFRSPFHVTLNSKVGLSVVYLARKFTYDLDSRFSCLTLAIKFWHWKGSTCSLIVKRSYLSKNIRFHFWNCVGLFFSGILLIGNWVTSSPCSMRFWPSPGSWSKG